MTSIKVKVHNNDKKIGAMVRGLAFAIENISAVKGAKQNSLDDKGYLTFTFSNDEKAKEFTESLSNYLPNLLAWVEKN